jgi:hypothetical protein
VIEKKALCDPFCYSVSYFYKYAAHADGGENENVLRVLLLASFKYLLYM